MARLPGHAWLAVQPVLSPKVVEQRGVEKVTFRAGHKSPCSSAAAGPGRSRLTLNGERCVSDPYPYFPGWNLQEELPGGGDGAPLLPPRLCWGPAFLFSLLLTWLIAASGKGIPRGEGEWGSGPVNEKPSEPLLHSWAI